MIILTLFGFGCFTCGFSAFASIACASAGNWTGALVCGCLAILNFGISLVQGAVLAIDMREAEA